MKTTIIYATLFPLLFTITMIFSCNTSGDSTNQKAEVKPLKERQADIGPEGEYESTVIEFEKISDKLKKDEDNVDAKLRLASLYINEGRISGDFGYYNDAAMNLLDNVLADEDGEKIDLYHASFLKSVILMSNHEFSEARDLALKAIELNSRNAGIYGVLVDAYVELGEYDKAIEMADKMVSIRPDLRSYSRISYLREIHGDIDGAKEAMEMAVKAGLPGQDETAWTRLQLGQLFENYGDIQTAEMHYSIILEERPNYAHAIAALGRIEAKKGNIEKAKEHYNRAIAMMEDAGFYQEFAELHENQGSEADSKKYAKKALEALQGHGHTHTHGGHTHSHGHSHETGLELANLYFSMGDFKEALEHAEYEIDRRPDNIDVNKTLSKIHYMLGDTKKARKHLELAMQTSSKDPELQLLSGLITIQEEDPVKGRVVIAQAFAVNPYHSSRISEKAKEIM